MKVNKVSGGEKEEKEKLYSTVQKGFILVSLSLRWWIFLLHPYVSVLVLNQSWVRLYTNVEQIFLTLQRDQILPHNTYSLSQAQYITYGWIQSGNEYQMTHLYMIDRKHVLSLPH